MPLYYYYYKKDWSSLAGGRGSKRRISWFSFSLIFLSQMRCIRPLGYCAPFSLRHRHDLMSWTFCRRFSFNPLPRKRTNTALTFIGCNVKGDRQTKAIYFSLTLGSRKNGLKSDLSLKITYYMNLRYPLVHLWSIVIVQAHGRCSDDTPKAGTHSLDDCYDSCSCCV